MRGHPLLVTADIHSSEEALEAVIALATHLSASRLLIAGDLCPHSQRMALLLQNAPFPYVAVKGNCDSLWDFKDLGLYCNVKRGSRFIRYQHLRIAGESDRYNYALFHPSGELVGIVVYPI